MIFSRPSLIQINDGVTDHTLSDHNRGALDVSNERIENSSRAADGSRHRYFVADKKSFSISWTELPNDTALTVDGGIGFDALKTLFEANTGDVTLKVYNEDNTTQQSFTCHITSFSYEFKYRWQQGYYYDCSISLEEV